MVFQVKTVELPNGMRLPYIEQGSSLGVPVVLLHGFLDSWHSFELVLPYLPDTFRCYALTQRGHGDASHPEPAGYSIVDLAMDLEAFMNVLQLRAAVIVGHSMGSAVALRFAIDHPERTLGLVLLGASDSLSVTQVNKDFWEAYLAKLTDPVDPDFICTLTASLQAQPIPQTFLDLMSQEGSKVPVYVWKTLFASRWRREGDYAAELGAINCPTLIIWGEHDVRYPREIQESLVSAIKRARLVVYCGTGHLLHWEYPERLAADIVAFVRNDLNAG